MPVSKKPRKARSRRRSSAAALFIPREIIAEIHSLVRRVELATEFKLPRGLMEREDVDGMREMINLATISILTRTWLDDEYRTEAGAMIETARNAFHTYYGRVLDSGKMIATGDELTALRDGIEIAGDLIHYSLDHEAFRFLKEYRAMKNLLNETEPGRIQVTADQIDNELERITR